MSGAAAAPSLRTPRLILRPWRDADLEPFAAMAADPEVMAHLSQEPGRAASDALAAGIRDHFAAHGYGYWAVELPGATPFIGFVGLRLVTYAAHFTPAVDLGWRLARDHWGHGYATEAAAASIDHGFGHLGLSEIVAYTVPANQRSRQVMHRLGMTHTAADDFDHPRLPAGHPLARHVLYRLPRAAWRGLPPRDAAD
ncbi:MAG: GNAT family N-acetyltransferase [Proteobacteria bacterium]|nr:GNAT family N-acetyltransferase [Pseudomonadota bacterium]